MQGAIEAAVAKLEPGEHTIAAAGRTDAGVHARGQVAHVDLARDWDAFWLGEALNHHLRPDPVAILDVARVPQDFHARFSAIARHYEYRIVPRRAPLTVEAGLAWQVRHALDLGAMREGAAHLIGHHDFTTFRSSICQAASPVKTLDRLDVSAAEGTITLDVRARSFLHNQVRSFVGTLERVGAGSWPPDRVRTALEARNRAACGTVAPPHGLYLMRVVYPEPVFASDA